MSPEQAPTQVCEVWNDMGHLCMKPTEIPTPVKDQINRDVYTFYIPYNNTKLPFNMLKPHVPQFRQINNWKIDYTYITLQSKLKLRYKPIPGNHPLWVLDNLLHKEECAELIAKANNIVNDNKGNRSWHSPNTGGKYSRVIMIDRNLADDLWNRIRTLLPERINNYKLVYLNDHFRFSRYTAGEMFPVHRDGKNYDNRFPDMVSESLLTLNIFLNTEGDTDYELAGGSTSFFNEANTSTLKLRKKVNAKAGRAALFWANQCHRGDIVIKGSKYLLRTDIMAIPL